MRCPNCKSEHRVKSGFMKGHQRYKCKECGCNYTVDYEKVSAKEKKMRLALALYLEGLGFHSIARLLNVSHVTVMNWIKKFGAALSLIRNPKPVKIMELDEIHTYVGSDGFGLVLIEKRENTLIWLLGTEAQSQV